MRREDPASARECRKDRNLKLRGVDPKPDDLAMARLKRG